MSEYISPQGTRITDEMIEKWEAELESGEYFKKGEWGPVTIHRPLGRPRTFAEPLTSVTFRAPKSEVSKLKKTAKSQGLSVSQLLRKYIADLPEA